MTRHLGFSALILFVACIPAANWLIGHVGTFCVPDGPCVIPVAPGISAPSGVLMIGFALVLRDMVQRLLGRSWGIVAVVGGAAISALIAGPSLALASGVAFLVSELADFAVYTPLQRRGLVLAVAASASIGLVVDSVVFLSLAFHSLDFLLGQIIGKAEAVAVSLPVIFAMRRVAPAA